MNENPESYTAWEQRLGWFTTSQEYKHLDTIDGEPKELEWNISQRFITFLICDEVQEFMSKMSDLKEQFERRIIFMSMFKDIPWESEDNEQECESNANLFSIFILRTWIRKEVVLFSW